MNFFFLRVNEEKRHEGKKEGKDPKTGKRWHDLFALLILNWASTSLRSFFLKPAANSILFLLPLICYHRRGVSLRDFRKRRDSRREENRPSLPGISCLHELGLLFLPSRKLFHSKQRQAAASNRECSSSGASAVLAGAGEASYSRESKENNDQRGNAILK